MRTLFAALLIIAPMQAWSQEIDFNWGRHNSDAEDSHTMDERYSHRHLEPFHRHHEEDSHEMEGRHHRHHSHDDF